MPVRTLTLYLRLVGTPVAKLFEQVGLKPIYYLSQGGCVIGNVHSFILFAK